MVSAQLQAVVSVQGHAGLPKANEPGVSFVQRLGTAFAGLLFCFMSHAVLHSAVVLSEAG